MITPSATSTNSEFAGGGIIYENGALEMIPQPDGYIQPGVKGSYDYVYQYKDHLGNIRVCIQILMEMAL